LSEVGAALLRTSAALSLRWEEKVMASIVVGDKYLARPTTRNTLNSISPKDDIRIGYVDAAYVTVHVIGKDGSSKQLAVPLDAFGGNFESDRFHLAPPNRGYALNKRAITLYK
jgi:hypothetical protein